MFRVSEQIYSKSIELKNRLTLPDILDHKLKTDISVPMVFFYGIN